MKIWQFITLLCVLSFILVVMLEFFQVWLSGSADHEIRSLIWISSCVLKTIAIIIFLLG